MCSVLGYTGERMDSVTRHYLLGNGVHGWLANALLEVVGDYVVPYIPRRAVAWIPGVGNRNFGRASKVASKLLGVMAAASYMALNRFDAYAYTESLYDIFFAAHLTISVASTVSTAASTLHKIARKGVERTPILVRHQRNSVNTISKTIIEPGAIRHSPTSSPSHSSLPNTPVPEPTIAAYDIRNSS